MQRVAQKLHESLDAKAADTDALDYESLLLRSAWRTLHAKVPFFLAKAGWKSVVRRETTRWTWSSSRRW